MELHKLSKIGKKKKKRKGRGYGSGKGGHTVGKGQKGQSSRSGFKKLRAWIRESKLSSLPKLRGVGKRSAKRRYFKSKFKKFSFNLKDLHVFQTGEIIDLDSLRQKGLIRGKSKRVEVKILGVGEIKKKFVIRGVKVSESARKKIEKAGGKVIE